MRVSISDKKFPSLRTMSYAAVKNLTEMAVDEFLSSEKGISYCAICKDTKEPEEQKQETPGK